jgi:hypothetical protein
MSIELTWLIASIAVLAAIAIVIVAAIHWQRQTYSRRAGLLELTRVLLVAGCIFTLCQPEYHQSIAPKRDGVVAVLYDVSESMQTQDIEMDNQVVSRAQAMAPLVDPSTWQRVADQSTVVFEAFASSDRNATDATDLNAALAKVTNNRDHLRAVVLASDGDWNIGESPASAARSLRLRGIPVYSLAVGSQHKMPDLEIASFDVPTFAVIGKPLRLLYSVNSSLPRDADVSVELRLPDGESRTELLRVPAMGSARGTFEWSPKRVGDETMTIRLQSDPLEKILDNNEQTVSISLRQESLRVLMIESYPRWEYRYTRNALERDPGIDVHCLMFHPDIGEMGDGRGYLQSFPTADELFRYDVVFVGDVGVGADALTADQCTMLSRLVETQAGGLILMPGFRGKQATLLSSSLSNLFPVDLDPAFPKGIGAPRPSQFQLTEAGRASLLTRLEFTDATNDEVWRSLPGFYWHAAVERARPGSQVLATNTQESTRFGRTPLIVTRTYGTGKVLFMGTDGAWRWRKGVEDLYHYRYWGQVVRWMAYQRTMASGNSMRLFFSPDRPKAGDALTLHCNAIAHDGEPLQNGTINAHITAPSGKTETVSLLKSSSEAWGLFSGTFRPDEGGDYRVTTTCRETGASLESEIAIEGLKRERIGQRARWEVLREISQITRGEMTSIDDLESVVARIEQLPEPNPVVHRLRIWSHPLWGTCLLILFGVFWTGRKWAGLV